MMTKKISKRKNGPSPSPKNRSAAHKMRRGRYDRHDPLYLEAKKQGYLARSIFKLKEIDADFRLISPNDRILDLGCAPGSWIQYVEAKLNKKKGVLIGIDLLPVKATFGPNVRVLQGDIFDLDLELISQLMTDLGVSGSKEFDVVLSDMAPNTTGIKSVDQDRSMALCHMALEISTNYLKTGGNMCVKVLEGANMGEFVADCKRAFSKVKLRRPKGTRPGSKETYVIAMDKKKTGK